jgi:transcriptional regulator with XRE-family HTH domain
MKTTQLLEALKRRHNLPSDYALAKFLGVSQPTTSRWANGRTLLDDQHAIRIAKLLDLPAGYVLACIFEERAERHQRTDVRQAWRDVRRALAPAVAAVFLGFLAATAPQNASAGTSDVYYVKRRKRQFLMFPEPFRTHRRPRQTRLSLHPSH